MNLSRALRALHRDWRAGDIQVILWAVVVAVAGLVSVAALSDRLQRALERQGTELLAADLVVSSERPAPPAWRARATQMGLRGARTVEFRSVAVAGEVTQLTEVKAVSDGYPLRGRLLLAGSPKGAGDAANSAPSSGAAWVDRAVLSRMGLQMGDSIQLGQQRFEVTRIILLEPDRGGNVFSIAPRVMINLSDLPATGLVQPGSLVRYRWLLAGSDTSLAAFRRWLETEGVAESDLQDIGKAQPRFRAALDRGERFLGLATLVSVLLAGVAIARAARHYARRHIDDVAIQRCFGASQTQIVGRYTGQLLLLSAAGSAIGCVAGYLGQEVLLRVLPDLTPGSPPAPSLLPVAIGMGLGMATVVGFGLPDILRLGDVPPLRVIRRDLLPAPPSSWLVYGLATLTMSALVMIVARDTRLALWVIGGTGLGVVCLTLAARALVMLLSLGRRGVGIEWRFGLGNLVRRLGSTTEQIVSLGLAAMALLLLTMVRQDLFEVWQTQLPPQTPNHFLVNIQTEQLDAVADFFAHRRLHPTRFTPIVRARLVTINGAAVDPQDFAPGFARRQAQRAANLSWTGELPPDNQIVAGAWWEPDDYGRSLLSVDRGYAEALGLALGDRVGYRVAERQFELTVSNLREISWDTFAPNFFLLVPPDLLDQYPVTYITSVHVPPETDELVQELVQTFPNITDIDVAALIRQVRQVLDKIGHALQYLFVFATAAGLVVLFAAIQTSRDERRREISVLRALGASSRQIKTGLTAEFAMLGLCAGLVGGLGASALGYALARFVFDLPYQLDPMVPLAGALAGTAVVVILGNWVCRTDITTAVWQALSRVDHGG